MKNSRLNLISVLAVSLLLSSATVVPSGANATKVPVIVQSASDKRQSQSISEDWQSASDVLLGMLTRDATTLGGTFQSQKSLKSSGLKLPSTIALPADRYFSSSLPAGTGKIAAAVFLHAADGKAQVTEIYTSAAKLSALEILAPILAKQSESDRLHSLAKLCLEHPSYKNEFLFALANMRDAQNFAIAVTAYGQANEPLKLDLLTWLARTGDKRAVPTLIAAANSSDEKLRGQAVSYLVGIFPGATGVDACLEAAYTRGPETIRAAGRRYLLKRGIVTAASQHATKVVVETKYQKAERLRTAGKIDAALELYLAVAEDSTHSEYVRRAAALAAVPHASAAQKEKLGDSMAALIAHDASSGNYIEAADTAELLRQLGASDPRLLNSLLDLLDRHDSLFKKCNRIATFAIADGGTLARQKGAEHILSQLKSGKLLKESPENQLTLCLESAWLGDSRCFAELEQTLGSSKFLNDARLLFGVKDKQNEAQYLIELLTKKKPLEHECIDWCIARLGWLKESAAADLIIAHLQDMKFQYDGYVADEALKSIGGEYVCRRLEKIACDGSETSRNAVNILCELRNEKALPVLRRIISSAQATAQTDALCAMARLGTTEDIPLLVRKSDYWTADRLRQSWALDALAAIRAKYDYDVNGPIRPAN